MPFLMWPSICSPYWEPSLCLSSLNRSPALRCLKPNSFNIINRGYLFFLVKDRNLFHRVDTIGNIFTSGENITNGVQDGSVVTMSNSRPGGCEFHTQFRHTTFQAYFRLSPLLKHLRKVVGVIEKKVVLVLL